MTGPDESSSPPRPTSPQPPPLPTTSPLPGPSAAGKFVGIARWLLVPGVAIGAMLVVTMVGRLLLPRPVVEPGGVVRQAPDWQRIVVRSLVTIAANGALVVAGSKMAPRSRRTTAVVLAGLTIGYAFLIHVVVHWGRGVPHWIDFSLAAIAALLAAFYIASTER